MNFFRDRDLDHFQDDGTKDPTSREYDPTRAAEDEGSKLSAPGPTEQAGGTVPTTATVFNRLSSRSPSKSPQKKAVKRTVETLDDAAEASLRKRMAGPSSGKAGLALDQEEINRIIYEVSKGSKFFDNERKKDAQVTEQIGKMLKKRDDKLREVPYDSKAWSDIEKEIDGMIARLEATRDLSRKIIHCDMDMFYASVELKKDPSLKGKAFGVGGGVLVTCSYEARKFGVRSGMATFVAKALCPHLIEVKNDMPSYVSASREIMDILETYDENMAQASLDEAYLDLTPYCNEHVMEVEDVVAQLRREVQEKTGLTVSVGIAPNKMLAKISSDKNKPNGQFRLESERTAVVKFMRDLSVRKVPGIGRVTERILDALGVKTCHDIWEHRVMLYLTFDGKIDWLLQAHLGLASNVVQPSQRHERKSVGRETTFSPSSDKEVLLQHLRDCCDQVQEDLSRLEFDGRTVTFVGKHDTYQRFSRAHTSPTGKHFHKADDIFAVAKHQFDVEFQQSGGLTLRLIGVRITNLRDLKQMKQGGPLDKMLKAAQNRPKPSSDFAQWSDEAILGGKGAAMTEAEEERQIRLAMEESLREVQGGATGSDPIEIPSSSGSVVVVHTMDCPICHRAINIPDGASEEQANARLNRHVDSCLSGFDDLPKGSKRKGENLEAFLQRS